MQASKIIDVTRSFIPVDVNTFPETLHATEREDSPEKRFPVIPYAGHNFLPTAAGYKSYFGTNASLGIDSLSPNKPQHIFIFQTQTYKNILVALCDTGIWLKNGGVSGAWTQSITLATIADGSYYEWTFTTIKNVLYAFRNNGAAYYKLETDGSTLGVAVTAVVPNFITVASQLGIFRLGARLAFWDGTNAVAWSNPDDFTDFTPAVLTGANVTTFNSVLGKISSIRTHGRHAICYATKSITLLEVAPAETFFVKASPILARCGVAYLKQAVTSSPDTVHFAYTDAGIYKIDNGVPELIVPEVYDYFRRYTSVPVYLELLQGRYLCFEALDPRLIDGTAQFSTIVIPPNTLTFAGGTDTGAGSLDTLHAQDPVDTNMCPVLNNYDNNQFTEQKAAEDAAVPPASRYPGSAPVAIYKCYISEANGPGDITDWSSTPCGGAKWDGTYYKPAPATNAGKLSQWTTDASNKTAKDGRDVWTDGKWTMERFVQYQSAIWNRQQAAMGAFVEAIATRSEAGENLTKIVSTTSTTQGIVNCAAITPADVDCLIGTYPTKFSPFQFGFNACSFWLTRYATGASDVKNKLHKAQTCDAQWNGQLTTPPTFNDPAYTSLAQGLAACQLALPTLGCYIGAPREVGPFVLQEVKYDPSGSDAIFLQQSQTKYYDTTRTQVSTSINREVPLADGILGVETAYCELIGYQYLDTNGAKQFTPVATCTQTSDKYPGGTSTTRQVPAGAGQTLPVDSASGSLCGTPYTVPPPTVNEDPPLVWPDQTVTYPAISFLLQNGSIAPVYPTKYGAFVYDLHLKKWGKLKATYKRLLDYSPINSSEGSTVSFDIFGILAGVIKDDGYIYLFDTNPLDSSLTWGKIGYYRAGMTDAQEVRIDFSNTTSNGIAVIDVSLDGKNIASDLAYSQSFAGDTCSIYPPYSGKWYNVTLTGTWDVSYIEFKGFTKGRR